MSDDSRKPAPAEDEAAAPAAEASDSRELAELARPEAPPDAEQPAATPAEPGAELDSLRRECAELKDQLLRHRADFENYRRRVERDRQAAIEEGVAELLRALVPTLDNLERATAAKGSDQALREGIGLVQRDLLAMLEVRGLRVLDPLGQPFDPKQHQALSHEVTPGAAAGIVVEVFGKGYLLGDRLLRPALVKVAKQPDDDEQAAPETVH